MKKHLTLASALGASLALSLVACKGGESYGETTGSESLTSETGTTVEATASDLAAPALIGEVSIAELGRTAPDFRLLDSNGNSHDLSDFRGEPVVLEWVNLDCPFVKKHYGAGNMQALQERYTGEGVTWLTICSSAPGKQGHLDGSGWNEAIAAKGMNATAVLIDESGIIGRAYDASTTPNMFVIDGEGQLVYSGAIDDQSSPSPSTIEGATNHVAVTLDALLAGDDVEPTATKPYGCSVKYVN